MIAHYRVTCLRSGEQWENSLHVRDAEHFARVVAQWNAGAAQMAHWPQRFEAIETEGLSRG